MAAITVSCAKRAPQPARMQSAELTEYVVPWENAFPSDVAVDSTGTVWFTDRLAQVIGRFDPATEQFTAFAPPTRASAPYGMLVAPDGTLWYAGSRAGLVGRADPATGAITEHRIPGATGGPHLIAWSNGVIWFSLRESGRFGRFDPATGDARIFEPNGINPAPYSVAVTPDGHVWFDSMDRWQLFEVDPRTDSIRVRDLTEPPPPGEDWATLFVRDSTGRSRRIAIETREEAEALPDSLRARMYVNGVRGSAKRITADRGGNIWITDWFRGRVVRYEPRAGRSTPFASLHAAKPYGIAAASSGQIWYSDKDAESIVILDPRTGERASVQLITRGGIVRQIAIDEKRGRVWLPMSDVGRIGVLRVR